MTTRNSLNENTHINHTINIGSAHQKPQTEISVPRCPKDIPSSGRTPNDQPDNFDGFSLWITNMKKQAPDSTPVNAIAVTVRIEEITVT